MNKIFSNIKKTYFFFLLLSLLFYGNSIKNGFCFDDSYVTVTNASVKGQKFIPNNQLVANGIKGIPKIWRSRYGHGDGTAYDYRPLVMSLFALEYTLFGPSPHINHFISIVLYSLIVFFLFMILKICLEDYPFNELFAFVCAILFLAHPLHTEVVNNIKCTDELLAMLFGLQAVFYTLIFFKERKIKYIVFGAVFLLLALYSKLTSALFIALIPLFLYFFLHISKKQIAFAFLGLLVCFFLYGRSKFFMVTEKEVRYFFHFENPLYSEQISFFAKILFSLKTLGIYIKLLFFPYPLRFYYGSAMVPTNLSIIDFEIILALVFLAVSCWFCFKTKNKIAIFGFLFFLISISPILNSTSPVAGIIGERLCFIASIGFIIFIVSVFFSFYKTMPVKISLSLFSKKPMVYVSAILFVFLLYTWNRNAAWKDEITLFEHDIPSLEKSAGANNLLANRYYDLLSKPTSTYSQNELVQKCRHHYTLAISDDSTVYSAFNNLGVVYFSYLGDIRTALNYFIRATGVNAVYPQAYENIANCYDKLGDPYKALKYYRVAVAQNPKQAKSYLQMVRILLREKRHNEAGKLFEITDKFFPDDYAFTVEKGNYYYALEKYDLAASKFEQAYLFRKNKNLAYGLFLTYSKLQNNEKAVYFKKEYASFPQ